MWSQFLHHLSLHFPIVLVFLLAGIGLWTWIEGETERLRRLLRVVGWCAFAATTATVVSGTWAAPGWLGGGGSEGLSHHRWMGWTTWCVVGLAAWMFERGERESRPDLRRLSIGLWCVATFSVMGTGHWGGAEEHPEVVPWLSESPEPHRDAERRENSK
jgi:hypothetical protein